MGSKNKQQQCQDHCEQDYCDDEQQIDVAQQVQKKIKELPTLKEKVHAIAINSYLIQKRNLDEQLQKQTEEVQQKFRVRFNPFIEQINKIITGQYIPNDNDFQEAGDLLSQDETNKISQNLNNKPIPEYWLKVFLNSQVLGQQIVQKDQPILKHLLKLQAEKTQDLKRLSVYFYFAENQWFSNTKLAKHFDIQDTQITKSYGDQINWKQGKNITIKIVKKKGKKGGKKTKQVKQKSFFNFFKDVQINSDDQDNEPQSQNQQDQTQQLQLQYQMAETIYQDLIPKSLQYYLNIISGLQGQDFEGQQQDEVSQVSSNKSKSKKRKGSKNSQQSDQ